MCHRCITAVLIVSLLLPSSPVMASVLSDILGPNIDLNRGTIEIGPPNPQAIPDAIRNLPKDVGQALLNPQGAMLATLIRNAEAQALHGAQPIPPEVRRILTPFFPADILSAVRWNSFDRNRITIDTAINMLQRNAITLGDVIVFPSAASATDPSNFDWWAHELTHFVQYRTMGIEGFANLYSINWEELENQARQWEQRIRGAVEQQQRRERDAAQRPAAQQQWASTRYYTMADNAMDHPLTSADFQQAAMQVFPAVTCANSWTTPQALMIQNTCPIPIVVTGWYQFNPYNGTTMPITCMQNCWLGAGQTMPFWSNMPGYIQNVQYRY